MATGNALFVQRTSDAEALRLIAQVAASVFQSQQVSIGIAFNLQVFNTSFRCPADAIQSRVELSNALAAASAGNASLWTMNVQAVDYAQKSISYNGTEPWKTLISISPNFSLQEVQAVIAAISSAFKLVREPILEADNAPQLSVEALKLQESTLAALSAETSRIAKHSLEQLSRQEEFLRQATADLRAQFNEQQRTLEEAYRKREEDLATRRLQLEEEVAARRQELEDALRDERKRFDEETRAHEQRVHEWNLRENTAERRRLLSDMRSAIEAQKSFALSELTNSKRRAVFWTCAVVAALAGLSVFAFGYRVFSANAPDWHHLVPFSAANIALVSTLVYFVRWNDQWAKEHARAEMRIKRFSEDILRASWLAELFFETKDKNIQVPDALFTNFSQGLFRDEPLVETRHPVDEATDLVKKLSSIEVGNVKITKAAEK
ncbi:hypothetical protein [Sorangium sp. So ce542]|uniref:hypothetical protein n=1 Tax=Sorangium sp. So ce542 TaxID=3133316 RepID=UPI003F6101CB